MANIRVEGLASGPPSLRELPGGEVEGPEVAPGVLPPDLPGVGEDQEPPPVGREVVVLDREGRGVARAAPGGRPGPMTSRFPVAGVVADQRRGAAGPAAAVGLELEVGRPVGEPADLAEVLRLELVGGVDPVEGEDGRIGGRLLGGERGADEEAQGRGRDEQTDRRHGVLTVGGADVVGMYSAGRA